MSDKKVALYHAVKRHETFEQAAHDLVEILKKAHADHPDSERVLYLDIDGHRNDAGGYDEDMMELQEEFVLKFLFPYLSEVHLPLGLNVQNPNPQEALPDEIQIKQADET